MFIFGPFINWNFQIQYERTGFNSIAFKTILSIFYNWDVVCLVVSWQYVAQKMVTSRTVARDQSFDS